MENSLSKFNELAEKKEKIEENMTELHQQNGEALEALKSGMYPKIADFCNELVTRIEQSVEDKNSKMQDTLSKIDENLTATSAVFDELTNYRSKFVELYNSISSPTISIDSATMVTHIKNGGTAEDLKIIPTKVEDVVSHINEIRAQHQPHLIALQQKLVNSIEEVFDQMGKIVSNRSEKNIERAKELSSKIDENLENARRNVEKISDIREKIHFIVKNNDSN